MSSPVVVRRSSFSSHDEAEITGFIAQMYADNRSRFSPVRHGARFSARTHDVPELGADRVRTSVAPATVRRAVAFLEENAHRSVQLVEVAEAAGTGARALQQGFRRHLGTTPLGHLRRIRLDLARRDLRAADPARGDTVAQVAARWGFTNAGRFATAYRAAHGESPNRTLLG